jgi:hypothetical protein
MSRLLAGRAPGVHAKLTRNPRGGLTPAQEHGAAWTSSPADKDDQANDNGGRGNNQQTGRARPNEG